MQIATTAKEDEKAKDLIDDAFERACREGEQEGCPFCGKRFSVIATVDLDTLWEKVMKIIGVDV